MALTKTRLGTNEDGTPHFHYAGEHVVITGPIIGTIEDSSGKTHDVSDAVVEADSPEHAAELAHLISSRYVIEGHPTDETFLYSPPVDADAKGIQMALASAVAANAALNGLDGTGSTNTMGFASLHTASPSTTGANENANSGSYARLAATWNAAASSAKTNSSSFTFTTGGSVAVSHVGTWSSATYGAGNYSIGAALGSSVTAVTITIAAGAISLSAA